VSLNVNAVRDEAGKILFSISSWRDITERVRAEQQLRILSSVVEQSANSIAIIDREGKVEYVNPKFLQLNEFDSDEVIGKNWRSFVSPHSTLREKFPEIQETVLSKGTMWKGIITDRARDGEIFWREGILFPIMDAKGEIIRTVYTSIDITARVEIEEKLRQQARTDPLTGIFNRRHFFELAEKELERARRYRRTLSVLIFDIDHFKLVNDTHGHAVGDQVLCKLTAECQAGLRENDIFARYGGEEFIILLPESDLEQARQMAERIRKILAGTASLEVGSASISLTVSVGVTSLDDENLGLDELILRADSALYTAKEAGRNCVSVWHPTVSDDAE